MDTDKPLSIGPHKAGLFTRLLSLFRRDRRPLLPVEDDFDDLARSLVTSRYVLGQDRRHRYMIYSEMDQFDMVSSILDLYAEEAAQKDASTQRTVWVESKNEKLVRAGDECLRNLQVEDRIFSIARSMCLFGDRFQRLIYQTGKGVVGWKYAPPDLVKRRDDKYDRLIGFTQDGKKFRPPRDHPVSWPWDYIHFRLLGRDDWTQYGTSLCYPAVRPWRQLLLAETAVLMYRLKRAPDRNLILADVAGMDPVERAAYLNALRKRLRKSEFVDPAAASYRNQYNPITANEDIFLPVDSDNQTRIETLSGAGNMDQLFDLDYFRNKFFGAFRVPKAFAGFEGEINARATLVHQDIRFARTVKRIQRALIYGLRSVLELNYALLSESEGGFTSGDEFRVMLPVPVFLDELERVELMQARASLISSLAEWGQSLQIDVRVWATYLLLNYAHLPEELVFRLVQKPPVPVSAVGGNEEIPGAESVLLRAKAREKQLAELEARLGVPKGSITGSLGTAGYTELTDAEKEMIRRAVDVNPQLRQSLRNIVALTEDYGASQVDPSTVAPRYWDESRDAVIELRDTYEDDEEARLLVEHMESLRASEVSKP